MDSVAGLFLSANNADEEKVIRNQYYQIPHPLKEIIQSYGKGTHAHTRNASSITQYKWVAKRIAHSL